tara:strand:+ start:13 stop:480 length:468 start_codon:yes stop_codon:yes gene_type:complete
MSTKAQMQTQINTIETGVLNPATTVRAVLGTESSSILENFYGLKLNDTNATTNVLTEVTTNNSYTASIIKQGYSVEINLVLRNNTSAIIPANTSWFSISNTDYAQETSSVRSEWGFSIFTGDAIKFYLTGDVLKNQSIIGIGERVELNLTYNTQS